MKKQDFLEKKIEQEISIARKNGTKNKRGIWKLFYSCIDLLTSTKNYKLTLHWLQQSLNQDINQCISVIE
jgi:hypothetical protein